MRNATRARARSAQRDPRKTRQDGKNMDKNQDETAGKCPFAAGRGPNNSHWWPEQLDIQVLHHNSSKSDPMGAEFDYAKEFKSLDLNAVVKDLHALMTDSQPWWPADFGHYGG